MTIGERIKQKRIDLGLSQDELAKKCGYKSRSSINKIELARDLPLKKIEIMANVLGVTPSYLMGWEEPVELNEELGELLVTISKSPRVIQLAKDFMQLSPVQQESVLTLVHSMIPETHS